MLTIGVFGASIFTILLPFTTFSFPLMLCCRVMTGQLLWKKFFFYMWLFIGLFMAVCYPTFYGLIARWIPDKVIKFESIYIISLILYKKIEINSHKLGKNTSSFLDPWWKVFVTQISLNFECGWHNCFDDYKWSYHWFFGMAICILYFW